MRTYTAIGLCAAGVAAILAAAFAGSAWLFFVGVSMVSVASIVLPNMGDDPVEKPIDKMCRCEAALIALRIEFGARAVRDALARVERDARHNERHNGGGDGDN